MRKLLAICLFFALGQAQAVAPIVQALLPSPLGIVITAGVWYFGESNKKVFQVDVECRANTFEEARTECFRLAVENAVGSLVASETEVKYQRITRDEIINYSSGYVDRYVILNRQDEPYPTVRMRVWVYRSGIADRLAIKSETAGGLDGPRADAQVSTLLHERAQGDRLVASVVRDFPTRSFNIEMGTPSVSLYGPRLVRLQVQYTLGWNYTYLSSLAEALEATAQEKKADRCFADNSWACKQQGFIRISSGTPPSGSGRWFGWHTTLGFSDLSKVTMLQNVIRQEPQVKLVIRNDRNEVVHQSCHASAELDHNIRYQMPNRYFMEFQGVNTVKINGDFKQKYTIDVNLGPQASELKDFNRMELSVVFARDCK